MPRIIEDTPVVTQPAPVQQPTNGSNPQVVTVSTLHGKKQRKVAYEQVSVSGVLIPRENLKVTLKMVKDMLGWETEADYQTRMLSLGKITSKDQARFRNPSMDQTHKDWELYKNTSEWQLLGPTGEPVVCWRNINNRPLDQGWVQSLAQDILNRVFLFNCENIIIGRTRMVISGQHRGIALIWACWLWERARNKPESERSDDEVKWLKAWPEEPYIESLVAYGADENQEVLMSIDNTKARTDSDNFYTSELVEQILTNLGTNRTLDRKDCSRMLSGAAKLLWTRTGAAGQVASYKTKQMTMAFSKVHQTILKCVQHIHSENSGAVGRAISDTGLDPGQAAAMMYLMGCSTSNGDQYRARKDRDESCLNWDFLDKAKEFWSLLAASDPDNEGPMKNPVAIKVMAPVRSALASIVDPEMGGGGKHEERQAIIAKAWNIFKEDCDILKASLDLKYDVDVEPDTGRVVSRKLLECPKFGPEKGGVDVGEAVAQPKARSLGRATKEEVEKEKAEKAKAHSDQIEQQLKEVAQTQKRAVTTNNRQRTLDNLKAQQPGKLLLLATDNHHIPDASIERSYSVYGTDAMLISKLLGVLLNNDDPVSCPIKKEGSAEAIKKIAAAHPNAVIVTRPTVPVGQEAKFVFTPIV